MSETAKGVWICLSAQGLFGVLYLFSRWMMPLSGTQVYALRVPLMFLGLLVIVRLTIGVRGLWRFYQQHLQHNLKDWGLMLLGSALFHLQMWLFMWAPVNGEGINTAMGYFLLPLVMVFIGWLMGEKLNRWQIAALVFAATGVGYEWWMSKAFSWTTALVAIGFPAYYLLRRWMRVGALEGLVFDLAVMTLPCLYWIATDKWIVDVITHEAKFYALLPLLGIISALGQYANMQSNLLLPMSLFGMLSYLEPALLFLAAVVILATPMSASAIVSYSLIWAALGLLTISAFRRWRWRYRHLP
ncbi:EamA family transporter [Suttonella ornithocola]|uniref:Putative chloramphenical resistance permease RarD n=1 Tax=Suttonella ornithocola TaxID=279832 RepID=A0A380MZH0_9GAMM|nr:hypothetical protein [Suttonella ornithocola]SUO97668.1 putative chloramphenical resistance permease RarD [Suttonella ornithocola]